MSSNSSRSRPGRGGSSARRCGYRPPKHRSSGRRKPHSGTASLTLRLGEVDDATASTRSPISTGVLTPSTNWYPRRYGSGGRSFPNLAEVVPDDHVGQLVDLVELARRRVPVGPTEGAPRVPRQEFDLVDGGEVQQEVSEDEPEPMLVEDAELVGSASPARRRVQASAPVRNLPGVIGRVEVELEHVPRERPDLGVLTNPAAVPSLGDPVVAPSVAEVSTEPGSRLEPGCRDGGGARRRGPRSGGTRQPCGPPVT